MKRYILFALCALVACQKPTSEKFIPEQKPFVKTGEITFEASIENASTKASLVSTGETRWIKGDVINVLTSDGSSVPFDIQGTGDTRKAFFKGNLTKEMGSWATYKAIGSKYTFPSSIAPSPSGECGAMAAAIKDSYKIEFKHLTSYINLQIKELSTFTKRLEISSEKSLSGDYSFDLSKAIVDGIEVKEGNEKISITIGDKPEANLNCFISIPTGEYNSLLLTAYDEEGTNIGEVELLPSILKAVRGDVRTLSATMPKYVPVIKIEGTVLVAGIYWAKGNLQHIVGSTDEGFQTDWRLAPNQYEYVNMENAGALAKAVTFKPSNYDQYDHFNWGGIASPFDNATTSMAIAPQGTNITATMFTDQTCTQATTDFAAAKYGDLAYWASNGKFRMPTMDEMTKLMTESNIQYAYYTLKEGKVISGLYFTNPEEGLDPIINDEAIELNESDFENGLFLPKTGRRYNAQASQINNQGTQSPYWTSVAHTAGDNPTEGYNYAAMMYINSAKGTFPYWNAAFDAKIGANIRPVYNK